MDVRLGRLSLGAVDMGDTCASLFEPSALPGALNREVAERW